MTIQTEIHDGIVVRTRTYRKVYKNGSYGEALRAFYDTANYSKWGKIYQLKGKERTLLAQYGNK